MIDPVGRGIPVTRVRERPLRAVGAENLATPT